MCLVCCCSALTHLALSHSPFSTYRPTHPSQQLAASQAAVGHQSSPQVGTSQVKQLATSQVKQLATKQPAVAVSGRKEDEAVLH